MISKDDLEQLVERGISQEELQSQIDRFKNGFAPIELARAATVGDGILRLSSEEEERAINTFESFEGGIAKFVPASGAATRMFKSLFEFRKQASEGASLQGASPEVETFFRKLKAFAFYDELEKAFAERNSKSIEEALADGAHFDILETLLGEPGLGYGNQPKGLLAFHRYPEQTRTPAGEQVEEGLSHVNDPSDLHLHFTVSPEFAQSFERHLEEVLQKKRHDIKTSFSSQEPVTDKVAVDLNNEIFRDEKGQMLFRPAGHGALLRNLNRIEEDVVFVKNIDNVLPDQLRGEVVRYKKILAGVLLNYQTQIFGLLERYNQGENVEEEVKELVAKLGSEGGLTFEEALKRLERPLRVCGMVKNVGEPGGGPFWVKGNQGNTIQIVEKAQVNLSDETQRTILEGSTHFNPVDIVCAMKDLSGNKYDLMNFRDDETGFITEKSSGGRKLKAMELPGLWNGAMADWNTVFVEVPLSTFSPVKTVNDLLKEEHQA